MLPVLGRTEIPSFRRQTKGRKLGRHWVIIIWDHKGKEELSEHEDTKGRQGKKEYFQWHLLLPEGFWGPTVTVENRIPIPWVLIPSAVLGREPSPCSAAPANSHCSK